jgi:hypothetical protein
MKELLTWFHANGLVANTEKTRVLSLRTWHRARGFSNLRSDLTIWILGINTKQFLGLRLIENIKWNFMLVSPCIFHSSLFIKHLQNALHFYFLLYINRPLHMFRFMQKPSSGSSKLRTTIRAEMTLDVECT